MFNAARTFYRRAAVIATLPLCLSFCKPRAFNQSPESTEKSLRDMKALKSQVVGKLPFAEKNGIPSTIFKETVSSALQDVRNYRLRVEFGTLTKAQYDLLMNRFLGRGFVPYDALRRYELADFLPPKAQTLEGRWLLTVLEKDPRIPVEWNDPKMVVLGSRDPVEVSVGMNCWMLAYEILRDLRNPTAPQELAVSYFGSSVAGRLFEAGEHFADAGALKKSDWLGADAKARNIGREVYDVLSISTQFNLNAPAHVALWVDDDIYLEKTNFMSDDPIRLAFFKDVVAPYLEQDSNDIPMRMEFLRPAQTSKPLPPPVTLAGKHPYGDNPLPGIALPKLPPDIAKSVIFSSDTSLGGGLGAYSVARIVTFPLKKHPQNGRAYAEGADKLSNFAASYTLCETDNANNPELKFKYQIDKSLTLFLSNPKTGKEVARIPGKYVSKKTSGGTVYAEFNASGKILTLVAEDDEFAELNHPGVADNISVRCIRAPKYFDKL